MGILPVFLGVMSLGLTARASSHREAPLISRDPQADNTDLYVFRSPDNPNTVTIIANYIPFESPEGGPNYYSFGKNVRYEIHIKNKTTTTGDDITYRFTFSQVNQDTTTFFNIRLGQQNLKTTYKCEKSTDGGASWSTVVNTGVVPPNNIGPRSIQNTTVGLGASSYMSLMTSAIQTPSSGESIFCGPVDDPFFADLAGIFDLGNVRPGGLSTANAPKDALARFNCHTIAMKIPISMLQKSGLSVSSAVNILDPNFVIGVWASASRQQIKTLASDSAAYSGSWIQVSRLGMPLTNEVIIPIGMKDKWNSANPANDVQFAKYFSNPELALYMDASAFGGAVPALNALRVQSASLGMFDFRNTRKGLYGLKGTAFVAGTALAESAFGGVLLPDSMSPRAVDILPIFYTGVPNLAPYQLATGKPANSPLSVGKPFINNFLPTLGDMLRLNMAVPTTSRTDPNFSSLGIVNAAVLGLTVAPYNTDTTMMFIPNMDGFPNGRRLEDDVVTIELQAVGGVALAAIGLWYNDYRGTGSPVTPQLLNVLTFNGGITKNDTTFQNGFPYVQQPWRGYDYSYQARF
ncbi:MAG: DUF4331 domain-containing protein [Taibaiella sp.]|nr:DUF4331 domain-containing protein [Taibaiella sp.]